MASYLWPGDSGWPTPETDVSSGPDLRGVPDIIDPDAEIDLDALSLHAPPPHLFDELSPLERRVLAARFGLDGVPVQSMKELHEDLGMTRHQVRDALESALAKLRAHLAV